MLPRWTSTAAVAGLAVLLAVAGSTPGLAQERQILDEYNADLYAGGDLQRLAAGLSFGDVKPSGFWWNYGGRVGSVWFDNGRVNEQGWILGGTVGFGFDPSRKVSPVAGLAVDFPFGAGSVDLLAQVHGGARIRLGNTPDHFALTVGAFAAGAFLGDGHADDSDFGVTVLFSAASLRPR